MRARVFNDQNQTVNTVLAEQSFLDAYFPGHWEKVGEDTTPVASVPRIRATSLKLRLVQSERSAYRAAAKNTPAVDDFWDLLNTGGCMFRLDDPTVLAGLALILTPQRVTTVTTDPVKPEELL